MFHPLAPNLSDLSMDEVSKKHGELMTRLNQAYRFGPTSAIPQLHMLQQHYAEEIQRRNQKQLEDMQEQMKKTNPGGFKDIIDIQ